MPRCSSLPAAASFPTRAPSFTCPPSCSPTRDIDLRIAELARAKQHYLRGREHVLIGIETRHPGFGARLAAHDISGALALVDRTSIGYLYWLAAAWLGAFATDPFDVELLVTRPQVGGDPRTDPRVGR